VGLAQGEANAKNTFATKGSVKNARFGMGASLAGLGLSMAGDLI